MQKLALVLLFLAIFFQICEILSENRTICLETSESHRSKRNHENDSSPGRKQIQSKTINTKDALDKKALLFLVKGDPKFDKQETRRSKDRKNNDRLVVDIHDGYGNNNQKYLGAKVMRINPLPANKIPKKVSPLTVPSKVNGVQKITVESNTKKTPMATVAKHQHHTVMVKPNVKGNNNVKNKVLEDKEQLEKQVMGTGKENQAQDVTSENFNRKTPSNLELEDLNSNNVMEMKEHKYEEIRINPIKYYSQVDTRNIKAIPDYNSKFGSYLAQGNPYEEMGYNYAENNYYYVCANNVDQGHQNCFDPYIGNEESSFIKKTWLDTEIKIKMKNLNQETNPFYYNNAMINSYNGAN